mgnify:FL=1
MGVKEMLEKVIDKGKQEDMHKLNDMLKELICDLKIKDPKMYKEYKTELYELAYGRVILKEKAEEIVENMRPYGEHYTLELVKDMFRSNIGKHSEVDYYLVINSLYNDYCDIIGDDDEMYKSLTKKWLDDEDAVEDKTYYYFMNIPKRD